MNKIEVFAYKANSFDAKDFVLELASYNKNSIIILFDYEKITVVHIPPQIILRQKIFRFFRTSNGKLNHVLLPFLFILDQLLLLKIILNICLKYRPKTCWVENLYAAFIFGVLKKFSLIGRLIYLPADWLVSTNHKKWMSRFGNNLLFPHLDRLVCKMSDRIVYSDRRLSEVRHNFWKCKEINKEKIYSPLLFPRLNLKTLNTDSTKNKICFFGDMRLDSGLDIAIKALPEIRKSSNIALKIIGHKTQNYEYFRNLSREFSVESCVKFLGYVESENLEIKMADCFCGINVLTSPKSYSSYGVPGKQISYLQFLLPIIMSDGAGSLNSVVKDNSLGIVIEPSLKAFTKAVLKIYEGQSVYRKNIVDFVKNLDTIPIKNLID